MFEFSRRTSALILSKTVCCVVILLGMAVSSNALATIPTQRPAPPANEIDAPPPQWVYRVDWRRPEVIFAQGFSPYGATLDFFGHVNSTQAGRTANGDGFVSTTDDWNSALAMAAEQQRTQRNLPLYIYAVRADGNFFGSVRTLTQWSADFDARIATTAGAGLATLQEGRQRIQTNLERYRYQREWASEGIIDRTGVYSSTLYVGRDYTPDPFAGSTRYPVNVNANYHDFPDNVRASASPYPDRPLDFAANTPMVELPTSSVAETLLTAFAASFLFCTARQSKLDTQALSDLAPLCPDFNAVPPDENYAKEVVTFQLNLSSHPYLVPLGYPRNGARDVLGYNETGAYPRDMTTGLKFWYLQPRDNGTYALQSTYEPISLCASTDGAVWVTVKVMAPSQPTPQECLWRVMPINESHDVVDIRSVSQPNKILYQQAEFPMDDKIRLKDVNEVTLETQDHAHWHVEKVVRDLVSDFSGWARIASNSHYDRYLDATSNPGASTVLGVWHRDYTAGQAWRFLRDERTGFYRMYVKKDGTLELYEAQAFDDGALKPYYTSQVYTPYLNPAKPSTQSDLWRLVKVKGKTNVFYVISVMGGYYLADLSNGHEGSESYIWLTRPEEHPYSLYEWIISTYSD